MRKLDIIRMVANKAAITQFSKVIIHDVTNMPGGFRIEVACKIVWRETKGREISYPWSTATLKLYGSDMGIIISLIVSLTLILAVLPLYNGRKQFASGFKIEFILVSFGNSSL